MSIIKSRLDDVCEVIMGQAPRGESYNLEGKGLPLIAGAGDFGNIYPVAKKFTTEASKISRVGDIVLGIRATIGEKVLSDGEYCLGRGVAALRTLSTLDSRYLWHWLEHIRPKLASKAKGATFKQVTRQDIAELEISLPPIAQQKRIAAILDQAEELRGLRRQSLGALDAIVQAIFLEMFGDPVTNPKRWSIVTIRRLLESASYGTSEKAGADGAFPILRMNNLTYSGEMDFTDLKFIDLKTKEVNRYTVRTGDVLFNRTNSAELVGKTAIYRASECMAYAGYLVRLRVNEDNHPEFLAAFLNSKYAKRMLRGMCKSIIGMANINANEVQEMRISKPPLALQQEFARRVEAIEQLKATHRESLAQLDALFASLQHRAFRGEL